MGERVHIALVSGRSMIRVKSWQRSVGSEFPTQVGEMTSGSTRALCLGPYEWLVISEDHDAQTLLADLEAMPGAQGLALANLTGALSVFEVQGPAARELLAKGCGLDIHRFAAGKCVRTRFAQIPLTIQCHDAPQRFELLAARSYAPYLMAWLRDAAIS